MLVLVNILSFLKIEQVSVNLEFSLQVGLLLLKYFFSKLYETLKYSLSNVFKNILLKFEMNTLNTLQDMSIFLNVLLCVRYM